MTEQKELPIIDGQPTDPAKYERALELARKFAREEGTGRISVSYIQRHMQIGYNAAYRLIEAMQAMGQVTAPDLMGQRHLVVDDAGKPAPPLALKLERMREAFVTAESRDSNYTLVFSFPSLEELQAAHRDWHAWVLRNPAAAWPFPEKKI